MFNVADYEHVINPFGHQRSHFEAHCNDPAWGLLWEQGTAKTKPTIDTGAWLYLNDEIDAMLVVAPSGVERNWKSDELPEHLPIDVALDTRVEVFYSKKMHTKAHIAKMNELVKHKGLAIMLISYDAFMTKTGKNTVWKFLRNRRCLYVLDEAHNIKTPGAKRTKSIVASSKYAPYRRILTGTPISKGPFDIYSQIRFVDNSFWQRVSEGVIMNAQDFRDYFGIWRKSDDVLKATGHDPGYDILLGYQRLDVLQEWLSLISDRVLKDDVLDLPPKLYSKRYVEMSPTQSAIYNELAQEYIYEFDDGAIVDADMPIVRLLRLQQVLCGYVPVDGDEPVRLLGNSNPRLNIMEDIRDGIHHQGIIWARFRHDVNQIMDLLGDSAVRYDGSVDDDQAERNKLSFQAGEKQWFVGTAQKGGPGLTLHMAKTMVYYSNSFKLIERLQSEDRAHRAGMDDNPVNYIDITCAGTVDEHIIQNLRNKVDIASQVTGDKLREWI